MDSNFKYLKKLCLDYNLVSLKNQVKAIENLETKNKNINIAILGQFKAGKSSFINSFIGSKILPVGVIPVTSAVTILKFGETESITVIFENKERLEINRQKLENYISELKNPKNIKKVDIVEIALPFLIKYKKLSLSFIEKRFSLLDSMITNIKDESKIYLEHINKLKKISIFRR